MASPKILDVFIEWNPNSEEDLRRQHDRWYGPNQELELVLPEGIPSSYIDACKVYYFHPFTGEKIEAQGTKTFSHSAGDLLPVGDKNEISVTFTTTAGSQSDLSSYLDPDGDPLYDISSGVVGKLLVKVVRVASSLEDKVDWTIPQTEWDYGEPLGPDFQAAQAKYLHREQDENTSFENLFVSTSPAPNAVVQGDYEYSFDIGEVLDAGTHILTVTFTPSNQPFEDKYNESISTVTKEISVTVNPIPPVIQWDTVQKSGAGSKGKRFISACEVVSEEVPYITNSQAEYPVEALSPVEGSVEQGDPVPGSWVYSPPVGTEIYKSTDISATFTPSDTNYSEVSETFSFLVPEKTETDLSVPTLFNGLVVSVDCNVGFGGDTSNCSFTVVDDPDNGFITDIPTAGTACYFRYKGFFFGGILQRWTYSESISGKKYNITLSSPSAFMDGVHIILDAFEGTAYYGDTNLVPWTGAQVPYQEGLIRNILNPLGYFENYTLGLLSGDDNDDTWLVDDTLIDDWGFGTWGDSGTNPQGFDAIKLLKTIEVISRGGTPHGDKLFFGESQYSLDLSELIGVVPEYYRVSGSPNIDLNSLVSDICELTQRDYIWEVTGETNDVCKDIGEPFVDQDNVVLKVKLIDKSSPPDPGVIAQYVEDAREAGNLVNSSIGKEFQNEPTQKIVLGGPATRYFLAGAADLIPVFGQTSSGAYILARDFETVADGAYDSDRELTLYVNSYKKSPFAGSGPRAYTATIMELRQARSGFDNWLSFKFAEFVWKNTMGLLDPNSGAYEGYSVGADANFGGFSAALGFGEPAGPLGGLPAPLILNNMASVFARSQRGPMALSRSELANMFERFQGYVETLGEDYNPVWQAVSECATNFYGRKFLIKLPEEPGGIENNLKVFKEDIAQVPSWELADSAWVEDAPLSNVKFYDSTGRLKPLNVYQTGGYNQGAVGETLNTAAVQGVAYQGPSFQQGIEWINWPGSVDYSPFVLADTEMQVETDDQFHSKDHGFLNMLIYMSDNFLNPRVSDASGINDLASLDPSQAPATSLLAHAVSFAPAVLPPLSIGVPQESKRYSWGPWYNSNHLNGKLDFVFDNQLVPESFGSIDTMSETAQAQADTGIATMEEVENGSIEIAEFPEYNIGDRLLATGPYVTTISIKIGVGGMTTSYRFNTWTPDFGKLQKYNQSRVSRIWRNKMNAAQKGGGSIFNGKDSTIKQQEKILDDPLNRSVLSPQMGIIAGNAGFEPYTQSVTSDVPVVGSASIVDDYTPPSNRPNNHQEIGSVGSDGLPDVVFTDPNGQGPRYSSNFGMSNEQSWVGFSSNRERNLHDVLPSVQDPDIDEEIVVGEEDENSPGIFNYYRNTQGDSADNNGSIMPTSNDLDPYFNYAVFSDNPTFNIVGSEEEEETNPANLYIKAMSDDFQIVIHDKNGLPPETMNLKTGLELEEYAADPSNDYTTDQTVDSFSEFRPAGLRGPMVLSGWGFDVANNPVPGTVDDIRLFNNNLAHNRNLWKTGPVNLMWDKERKIWSGGLETLTGIVVTDVESPESPMSPTTFNLKVLRKVSDQKGDGALAHNDPPEIIKCYNRDPKFSMNAGENSYLTVMRINYEWVPLSSGGGVDLVSFETQEPEEDCPTDTQVWWFAIDRTGNGDASDITNPALFPEQSDGNYYDWGGFQPRKPDHHLDYCQNEGESDGKEVWRNHTEVIYEAQSVDNIATNQGEGRNMQFWLMKTCYPRPSHAFMKLRAIPASEINVNTDPNYTGDFFGIRDSQTNETGNPADPLGSELDDTLAHYFFFVKDWVGDLSDDDQTNDFPSGPELSEYPTYGNYNYINSAFPAVPVYINDDMTASDVAQAIMDAWRDAPWTNAFSMTQDCEEITITQATLGLTGDQNNEGLARGALQPMTSTHPEAGTRPYDGNFSEGEGFDATTWLADNSSHMIDWVNLSENANYFTNGAPNDAWTAGGGAWSGPTDAPVSGTGTIYEGGINREYGYPNSLRRDDWLDMIDMLSDMSGYLGSHNFTINERQNLMNQLDENGVSYLEDCNAVDRRCITLDTRPEIEEIIGRITQYPCGVTSVPDEISVTPDPLRGAWEEDPSGTTGGYIKIKDPMEGFFGGENPRRFESDLRGRRGVAMRVWDYLPNGPCHDDPDYDGAGVVCENITIKAATQASTQATITVEGLLPTRASGAKAQIKQGGLTYDIVDVERSTNSVTINLGGQELPELGAAQLCSGTEAECYWMVVYMDMFDTIELVHDIIIGTRTITTKKKKIDVWNHCDLDDDVYQGEDCTFEDND